MVDTLEANRRQLSGIYCTELRIVHGLARRRHYPPCYSTRLTGVTPAWTVDTTGHAETSKDVLLTLPKVGVRGAHSGSQK